jgi:hypothetical protein
VVKLLFVIRRSWFRGPVGPWPCQPQGVVISPSPGNRHYSSLQNQDRCWHVKESVRNAMFTALHCQLHHPNMRARLSKTNIDKLNKSGCGCIMKHIMCRLPSSILNTTRVYQLFFTYIVYALNTHSLTKRIGKVYTFVLKFDQISKIQKIVSWFSTNVAIIVLFAN